MVEPGVVFPFEEFSNRSLVEFVSILQDVDPERSVPVRPLVEQKRAIVQDNQQSET